MVGSACDGVCDVWLYVEVVRAGSVSICSGVVKEHMRAVGLELSTMLSRTTRRRGLSGAHGGRVDATLCGGVIGRMLGWEGAPLVVEGGAPLEVVLGGGDKVSTPLVVAGRRIGGWACL